MPRSGRRIALVRRCLVAVGLLSVGVVYVDAALRHGRTVNTTIENTDQAAYLEYAINIHENGASYIGGRNQMPLYPLLQSLVYDRQSTVETSFARGKLLNIVLSLFLLGVLYALLRARFSMLQATALLLVTAFTVFLFRAAYIQVELLFYVLLLGTFLLCCQLLVRPSMSLAVMTGLLAAVTHLAKAAVLPALVAFLSVGAMRAGWLALAGRKASADQRRAALRSAGSQAAALAVVATVFLVSLSPYLITSKRVYGSALYNVNSTFYMWYDSWADARAGTIRAGDRFGWPALEADAVPGPLKYLREHTPRQIAARFRDGLAFLLGEGVRTYGYWKYVVFYGLAAVVVSLLDLRRTGQLLRDHAFVILFASLFLGGSVLLYSWYVPIARGNRLVLALFLPFMYSAAKTLDMQGGGTPRSSPGRHRRLVTAIHVAMIVAIALELPNILTDRIVTVYGGG